MSEENSEMKPYPFTWTEISPEEKAERAKMWNGPMSVMVDMVRCDQMNVLMPKTFVEPVHIGQKIWKVKPRPDDIWMVTYPKCGSTLGQELLWQLTTGCDVESAKTKEIVFLRVPFIEMGSLAGGKAPPVPSLGDKEIAQRIHSFMSDPVEYTEGLEALAGLEGPRVIKTHLPVSMLPPEVIKTSKVLVINRSCKDSCTSFFHHEQLLPPHGLDKDAAFDDYAEKYLKGDVMFGDYWQFFKDAMKYKDEKNFKMIWYEDLRKDLGKMIGEIGDFIGHRVPEGKMEAFLDHLDINRFRKNDAVNMKPPKGSVPEEVRDNFNFIRKGKVGDWKDHFKNPEVLQKFQDWIESNDKDQDGNSIDYKHRWAYGGVRGGPPLPRDIFCDPPLKPIPPPTLPQKSL